MCACVRVHLCGVFGVCVCVCGVCECGLCARVCRAGRRDQTREGDAESRPVGTGGGRGVCTGPWEDRLPHQLSLWFPSWSLFPTGGVSVCGAEDSRTRGQSPSHIHFPPPFLGPCRREGASKVSRWPRCALEGEAGGLRTPPCPQGHTRGQARAPGRAPCETGPPEPPAQPGPGAPHGRWASREAPFQACWGWRSRPCGMVTQWTSRRPQMAPPPSPHSQISLSLQSASGVGRDALLCLCSGTWWPFHRKAALRGCSGQRDTRASALSKLRALGRVVHASRPRPAVVATTTPCAAAAAAAAAVAPGRSRGSCFHSGRYCCIYQHRCNYCCICRFNYCCIYQRCFNYCSPSIPLRL